MYLHIANRVVLGLIPVGSPDWNGRRVNATPRVPEIICAFGIAKKKTPRAERA